MVKVIHSIVEFVGKATSWLTTILVLFVCFDVFRRYFLKDSAAWIMELEWHLFALIFLLGAAYTLKHNKHIRVDVFYENFSPKDKALVNLIGGLVLLIPWCCIMIYMSWTYAYNSFLINESSPDPGGLPARYIIKFSIVLGIGLLLLQSVAMVIESWQKIKSDCL